MRKNETEDMITRRDPPSDALISGRAAGGLPLNPWNVRISETFFRTRALGQASLMSPTTPCSLRQDGGGNGRQSVV